MYKTYSSSLLASQLEHLSLTHIVRAGFRRCGSQCCSLSNLLFVVVCTWTAVSRYFQYGGPLGPIGLSLSCLFWQKSFLSISTCCVTRFLFDWSEASALFCLNHIRYDKHRLTRVNPIWFDNYILRCGMIHIFQLIGLNPT